MVNVAFIKTLFIFSDNTTNPLRILKLCLQNTFVARLHCWFLFYSDLTDLTIITLHQNIA